MDRQAPHALQGSRSAVSYLSGRSVLWLWALMCPAVACNPGPGMQLPPIVPTPTAEYLTGKFVWRDLLTQDLPAVERFYGTLFGWEFEAGDSGRVVYRTITHRGRPIGGVFYTEPRDQDVNRSQWVSYLSVSDVDGAVEQVRAAGGTVHTEPRDFPDRGRIAVVSDAQGALLAVVRSSGGDPEDREPMLDEWMWTELWTNDVAAAESFYGNLVGYQPDTLRPYEASSYLVFMRDGRPRAGLIEAPDDRVRPNWLPYLRVDDPAAVAAQVESLGGKVLLAPDDDVRNGDVAIIADPSGAALTVQRWPPRGPEGRDLQ
jgi:predicted enzyme related to lactoylglutathione lyase